MSQPPDVFLEDQLERAPHALLSSDDPSLPPALRELPGDWQGLLAAYGGAGNGRYVLSVRFDPFQADLYAGDELAVSANRRCARLLSSKVLELPGESSCSPRYNASLFALLLLRTVMYTV